MNEIKALNMLNRTIFIFLLFFSFCKVQKLEPKSIISFDDRFKISNDMLTENVGNKRFFDRMKLSRDYLGDLDTLERGYHELQVRIWLEYEQSNVRQLIIIKYNSIWYAELQTISTIRVRDSVLLANRVNQKLVPKSGWRTFIMSLSKMGIFNLPDQTNVKGMEYLYNSSTVHIEAADSNHYRFYSYTSPRIYVNEFIYAKKLEEILNYISTEFGIKFIEQI